MVKTTKAQRAALKKVWLRDTSATYREFRKTVQPSFGYIMVPFAGMWLGIETDGYTHS